MNSQQSQHESDLIDEPEIFLQNSNGTEEDLYFDSIVGALQDTVLEEEFTSIEENFMKNYCGVFEDKEENKMEYMLIFNNYQQVIEKYILQSLTTKIPQFSMEVFSGLLATRTNQIDQDLLEMIKSFTDFEVFKNMMLEFKTYYGEEDKFNGLCVKGAVCKM